MRNTDLGNSFNKFKKQFTMKVKVEREIKIGTNDGFFNLSIDGSHYKSFAFKIGEKEGSVWNEAENKKIALKIAKEIEERQTTSVKETIYETHQSIEEKTLNSFTL